MATARKTKVSVTIDSDLLEQIDRYARKSGIGVRSNVIELWLRRAARDQAAEQLERDTIAYYADVTPEIRAEDAAWSHAATSEFQKLDLD